VCPEAKTGGKEVDDVDDFLSGYVSEPSNEIEQSLERYWTSLNERSDTNTNSHNHSANNVQGGESRMAITGVFPDRLTSYRYDNPVVLPRLVIEQKANRLKSSQQITDIENSLIIRRQHINEF
jgi:hypothetical protein